VAYHNKKHLKNVGPIRNCEPPYAHSPGVATGTVARRLRIDVHDDNDGQQRQRQRVTEGPITKIVRDREKSCWLRKKENEGKQNHPQNSAGAF